MPRLRVVAALLCGLSLFAGILQIFGLRETERAEGKLEMERSRVEREVSARYNDRRPRARYGETDLQCPFGQCNGKPRTKTTEPLLEPTAR